MHIEYFLEASLAIQVHMIAAIAAFVLGLVVLWRRKGGARHRINGRIWVALMMVTAFSGFFIHEIRVIGNFSPIHLFSVLVPVSLVYAIHTARKGRIAEHQRTMRATFMGGMLIAGGFTFLPGRLNYRIVFGNEGLPAQISAYAWVLPILAAFAIAAWVSRSSEAN